MCLTLQRHLGVGDLDAVEINGHRQLRDLCGFTAALCFADIEYQPVNCEINDMDLPFQQGGWLPLQMCFSQGTPVRWSGKLNASQCQRIKQASVDMLYGDIRRQQMQRAVDQPAAASLR